MAPQLGGVRGGGVGGPSGPLAMPPDGLGGGGHGGPGPGGRPSAGGSRPSPAHLYLEPDPRAGPRWGPSSPRPLSRGAGRPGAAVRVSGQWLAGCGAAGSLRHCIQSGVSASASAWRVSGPACNLKPSSKACALDRGPSSRAQHCYNRWVCGRCGLARWTHAGPDTHRKAPLFDGDNPLRVVHVGGRATQPQGVERAARARLANGGQPSLEQPHDGDADRALQSLAKGKELPPIPDARRGGKRVPP